jgi:hypothetical protein
VIAVLVVVAMFVPLFVPVPVVVVTDVAPISFPATGVVPPAPVVGRDPVRTCIRRPRPIAVVPPVAPSQRILVALDPHMQGLVGWYAARVEAEADRCNVNSHCAGRTSQ